jgi:16S rRNA (guanine527-N7)-methyltransferase
MPAQAAPTQATLPPEARAQAGAPAEANRGASAPGDAALRATLTGQLHAGAQALGLALDNVSTERLLTHAALLQRWNKVHNLTARDEAGDLASTHLLDCMAIVPALDELLASTTTAPCILDAGSGGGLPGLVLASLRPQWQLTLVDAVQKKCAFLEQVRAELRLANVTVRHARLEQLARDPRVAGRQTLVVARAFATLADLVSLTAPLLAPHGQWAAMKGRLPQAEIEALPPTARWIRTITLRVPALDAERHLVLLRPTTPGN